LYSGAMTGSTLSSFMSLPLRVLVGSDGKEQMCSGYALSVK
jgi:hypothetical protein